VLTSLSKKLNPFPFRFIQNFLSFGTTDQRVWLIKKNLAPEFSGIWREIIDFPLSSVAMQEKLGEVIQEPGKVKGFIELVLSNQPGWKLVLNKQFRNLNLVLFVCFHGKFSLFK
jgi:hypothetical protein